MRFARCYTAALCVASAASLISWSDYVDWYQSLLGLHRQKPHATIQSSKSIIDSALERIALIGDSAQKNLLDHLASLPANSKCTKENVKVRREWNTLSGAERIAFTDALKCLKGLPSRTPSHKAPGAKSRYDDWISTHLTLTPNIHWSGLFLVFHRYFTWSLEQALTEECGFDGTIPYWDFALTSRDGMNKSAMFDGSATSMSGNGEKIETKGTILLHDITPVPAGSGGGCVTDGPFKDWVITMGPENLLVPGNTAIRNPHPLEYNPRCLTRSFTQEVNDRFSNASSILRCLEAPTIKNFTWTTVGWPNSTDVGPHSGGHYAIGGDPGRDFSMSPGEPLFWVLHSQVDRMWWMWQMQDREDRTFGANSVSDHCTMLNVPPSPLVTLDTLVTLLWTEYPTLPVRDLMSTTDGPLCYMYE